MVGVGKRILVVLAKQQGPSAPLRYGRDDGVLLGVRANSRSLRYVATSSQLRSG